MLLHAIHAAADYESIIVVAGDTDVLILCMAVQARIGCNFYVTCGTRVCWKRKMC